MLNSLDVLTRLIWPALKRFFSGFALLAGIFAVICVLSNNLLSVRDQAVSANFAYLAYLILGLVSGYSFRCGGLFSFLMVLPLAPNAHSQLTEFIGIPPFTLSNPGLDLATGFVLGLAIQVFKERDFKLQLPSVIFCLPWQVGLLTSYLSLSTLIAVIRNLRQSATGTSAEGILFNFIHFRPIAWHDDFMPVSNLIAYGLATVVFGVFLSVLKSSRERNCLVFRPLIVGLSITAMLGCIQALTGFGLPEAYINFRKDGLGFVAIGFQPDIHSYAGHVLLGAVGLWAYFFKAKSTKEKIWIGLVIGISWLVLILSKSRASLALGILFSLSAGIIYIWIAHRKHLQRVLMLAGLGTLLLSLGALYFIGKSQFPISNSWLADLFHHYSRSGFMGLSAGTQNFGGRPEIYLAGIRMFSHFPLLGLGQGGFFRQSADIEFSKSFMLAHWGGENAHNYFLQVLVENGLVGILLFGLVVAAPFYLVRERKVLLCASFGFGALMLGNIFAHSFLVRENLILAAVFLALMYSWAKVLPLQSDNGVEKLNPNQSKKYLLITTSILIILILGGSEVYRSLYRFPYQTGVRCFVNKPLGADGWSSGILEIPLPAQSKGLRVYITSVGRPDLHKRPLQARIDAVYYENYSHDHPSLATAFYEWRAAGPGLLELNISDSTKLADGRGKAVMRVSNCFNPRDYGINFDGRNLGVLIDRIEVF